MEAYPANPRPGAPKPEAPQKPEKAEKIITGNVIVKKAGPGQRLKAHLTGDDGKSVGHHIVHDVLLPSALDIFYDAGVEVLGLVLGRSSRARTSGKCFAPKDGSVVSSNVWRMRGPYTLLPSREKVGAEGARMRGLCPPVDRQTDESGSRIPLIRLAPRATFSLKGRRVILAPYPAIWPKSATRPMTPRT